jgi:Spy/CpxP family protein refolding chaperone
MSEELDLNDQQSSQIKAIVEKHQSEINASRQQLASIREQTHAQVSAVLDDQQRQKFEALNKQAKDKRKGKKPSQNKLETMRTQLTLTDAQTASIDTVLSSSRKQLQAIHMKNRELRRQMNSEIKTVLNSQQQVKFESMQQQRKDKYKERKGNKHKTPE